MNYLKYSAEISAMNYDDFMVYFLELLIFNEYISWTAWKRFINETK